MCLLRRCFDSLQHVHKSAHTHNILVASVVLIVLFNVLRSDGPRHTRLPQIRPRSPSLPQGLALPCDAQKSEANCRIGTRQRDLRREIWASAFLSGPLYKDTPQTLPTSEFACLEVPKPSQNHGLSRGREDHWRILHPFLNPKR